MTAISLPLTPPVSIDISRISPSAVLQLNESDLSWFQPNRYQQLNQLKVEELVRILLNRHFMWNRNYILRERFGGLFSRALVDSWMAKGRIHPDDMIGVMNSPLALHAEAFSSTGPIVSERSIAVRTLEQRDFIWIAQNVIRLAAVAGKNRKKGQLVPPKLDISTPAYLAVNLDAPKDELEHDFKVWLKKARAEVGALNTKGDLDVTITKWVQARVIQLIDVELFRQFVEDELRAVSGPEVTVNVRSKVLQRLVLSEFDKSVLDRSQGYRDAILNDPLIAGQLTLYPNKKSRTIYE